ncbi:spermidine synthase, partial [Aureobasidium melanogenum]
MAVGYQHPNVTTHVGDGFKFLDDKKGEFDVIITDSSDPEGPAEALFQKPYFELLKGALREGGVITTQAENQWLHLPLITKLKQDCKQVFPNVEYGYTTIPTYPSGQIGFMVCCLDANRNLKKPVRQWSEAEEDKLCKYYNKEIHEAAFVLPNFAKKALKRLNKIPMTLPARLAAFLPDLMIFAMHLMPEGTRSPSCLTGCPADSWYKQLRHVYCTLLASPRATNVQADDVRNALSHRKRLRSNAYRCAWSPTRIMLSTGSADGTKCVHNAPSYWLICPNLHMQQGSLCSAALACFRLLDSHIFDALSNSKRVGSASMGGRCRKRMVDRLELHDSSELWPNDESSSTRNRVFRISWRNRLWAELFAGWWRKRKLPNVCRVAMYSRCSRDHAIPMLMRLLARSCATSTDASALHLAASRVPIPGSGEGGGELHLLSWHVRATDDTHTGSPDLHALCSFSNRRQLAVVMGNEEPESRDAAVSRTPHSRLLARSPTFVLSSLPLSVAMPLFFSGQAKHQFQLAEHIKESGFTNAGVSAKLWFLMLSETGNGAAGALDSLQFLRSTLSLFSRRMPLLTFPVGSRFMA